MDRISQLGKTWWPKEKEITRAIRNRSHVGDTVLIMHGHYPIRRWLRCVRGICASKRKFFREEYGPKLSYCGEAVFDYSRVIKPENKLF